MIKTIGRKILWVFIFCFVSVSVSGSSGSVLRNDLNLLLSNLSIVTLSYRPTEGILQLNAEGAQNIVQPIYHLPFTIYDLRADQGQESSRFQVSSSKLRAELVAATENATANFFLLNTATEYYPLLASASYVPTFSSSPLLPSHVSRLPSSQQKSVITSTGTSGNWSEPQTWVGRRVPTAEDDVVIASGTTVIINREGMAVNNLTIQGILNIIGPYTLNVGGDWTNHGTFNAGPLGIVEFSGETPTTLSGTVTTNFQSLVINKGNSRDTQLDIYGPVAIGRGGQVNLANGLLKINSGGSFLFNRLLRMEIPPSAGIQVDGGLLTTEELTIVNRGLFQVSQGTVLLGQDRGISLQTGPGGTFRMEDGNLNLAGRLLHTEGSALLSGGTILISTDGNDGSPLAGFEVSEAAQLSITGGTVAFNRPNALGLNHQDIRMAGGSNKTITGGTFRMGSAELPLARNYVISSGVAFHNLAIEGSRTKVTLGEDLRVNNQLTLNGPLMVNEHTLEIGPDAPAIAGRLGDRAGMVVATTGQIRKRVSANGTFAFPLGDASPTPAYAPVALTFTEGSFGPDAAVSVKVFNTRHPQDQGNTHYLNRYWTVQTSGIDSPRFNLKATYQGYDVVGLDTRMTFARFDKGQWIKDGFLNAPARTLSVTGVSDLSQGFSSVAGDQTPGSEITPPVVQKSATIPKTNEPVPVVQNSTAGTTSTITGNLDVCVGLTTQLTGSGTPAATNPWVSEFPAIATVSSTGLVTGVSVGSSNITYTDNFDPPVSVPVTVNPLPTITLGVISKFCPGSANFTLPYLSSTESPTTYSISAGTPVLSGFVPVVDAALGGSPLTISLPAGVVADTYQFNLTVKNANGCVSTSQTFNVTFEDITDPTISCPTNVSVVANAGLCTASGVALGTPITADNCSVASTTNNAPATFSLGTTNVTWTVTDGSGNIATCIQTVTVTDNQNPTITCPANVSVGTDAGLCTASGVSLGTPVTADNCSVASVTNNAPATFSLGITNVTWTVTDGSGNTATCMQTVTVTDNQNPTITCPANVSVAADAGLCTASGVALGTPTTADNCSVASATNNAPATFSLGITNVIWTVTDGSGNTATCTMTVTVTDNQNPTITCPANVSVAVDAGICTASGVALGTPITADNCSVASTTNNAPATFPLGITNVTWTVTDGSGNIATCIQTVTVTDNQNPTITCPANVSVAANVGICTASGVALGTPVTADNCSVASVTNNAPVTFPSGSTTVVWTVTDGSGNTATCNQTVTVTDNQAPVITGCPTNITVYTGIGSTTCEQTATWTAPAATDNCTATGSLVWTNTHLPGATFPVGTTIVTYTAKDASNNTATCTFNVVVIDNTKPMFNAPGNASVNVSASCNVSVAPTFTGPVSGLFDNCTIPANLVITYTDGASTPVGAGCAYPYSFTRTWKVTDAAGNFEEKTQLITVRDLIKPVISIPINIARSCEQSILSAATGTATAIDNCPGSVTVTYTDATAAGSCAGNSVITRTWSATDCSGNISTGVQLITVSDGINPTATAPPNPNATCPSTIPLAYANYAQFVAAGGTASDNCGPVTVVLYDEIANGLEGKPGYCPTSLTRTYRVTDQCGNYTDVVQTVNIAGACGCSPCITGTNFHYVDMLNDPTGSITIEDQIRDGKCCNAKSNEDCISFNVRIDEDAVGVEILIGGAAPSPQDWRIDCTAINMSDGIVCIPGGAFHLFTFCKPGQNANDFTFRSIPGIIAAPDINARVECNGQLEVTGIASNPVWTSISPGIEGAYNSYLSSTTILNPLFTAPVGAPPVIQYRVCGNIGSTVCNALGTDCDVINVYVKEEIDLHWNIDPTLVCANNIPTFVADISPAGATYTYQWYSGYGATGTLLHEGSNSYKPTGEGPYSLRVTDTQNGIPCSTEIFNFDVEFDVTGAAVFSPPNDLTIECNASNASTLIQNWLATAVAEDEDGNSLPVTNNYNGINMVCGTDLLVTFSASDHCGNIGTATKHIFINDTQIPTWLTAAGNLDRTLSCSDAAGIATAQALAPVATDVCDPTLTLIKTSGTFAAGTCPNAGTYTNTWTATDDCNNVGAVFNQIITLTDNTPPVMTTPAGNQTVECDGSGNTIALNAWLGNHGGAVATDACGGAITWTHNYTALSDMCGATGSATVIFTATDVCGNPSTTQATITIVDTQGPAITCPLAATGTADSNECFTINLNLGSPTVNDDCGNVTVSNNLLTLFPTGRIPVGVHTITWTATDACNNPSTCSQTVTITDNSEPPVFTFCPPNQTQTTTTNDCQLIDIVLPNPEYDDNCGVTKLLWAIENPNGTIRNSPDDGINYVTGQTFLVGTSKVTYIAYDAAGNPSLPCSFNVWIKDYVKPVFDIACPTDITVNAATGFCEAFVTVPVPEVSDPCGEIASVINSFNGTDNASGTYPVGITTVQWTITDDSGNETECDQKVTVIDINVLAIGCPPSITRSANEGENFASPVAVGTPTVTENCFDPKLSWVMVPPVDNSVDPPVDYATFYTPAELAGNDIFVGTGTYYVGVTTIYYTVTDTKGTTVTCDFTITVTAAPKIKCPDPIVTTTDLGVIATDPGFCTATRNPGVPTLLEGAAPITWTWTMTEPDGNVLTDTYVKENPDPDPDLFGTHPFKIGLTTITWRAANVSGFHECSQTITVTDNQLPTFTAPRLVGCVENIAQAVYNDVPDDDPYDLTYLRPDYYTFVSGDDGLDLDPLTFLDNCMPLNCAVEIRWKITMADGTTIPTLPALYKIGQPSTYGSDIVFLGDGITFLNTEHTITYWIVDCAGNVSDSVNQIITIKPRPEIEKLP